MWFSCFAVRWKSSLQAVLVCPRYYIAEACWNSQSHCPVTVSLTRSQHEKVHGISLLMIVSVVIKLDCIVVAWHSWHNFYFTKPWPPKQSIYKIPLSLSWTLSGFVSLIEVLWLFYYFSVNQWIPEDRWSQIAAFYQRTHYIGPLLIHWGWYWLIFGWLNLNE